MNFSIKQRVAIREEWLKILEEHRYMDTVDMPKIYTEWGLENSMGIRNDVTKFYKLNSVGCLAKALDSLEFINFQWVKPFTSQQRRDWQSLSLESGSTTWITINNFKIHSSPQRTVKSLLENKIKTNYFLQL